MPEGTRLPGPLMDFHCKGNRFDCQCPRVQIALGSAPFLHGLHRFGSLRTGMDKDLPYIRECKRPYPDIGAFRRTLGRQGKRRVRFPPNPRKVCRFSIPRTRSPATPPTSRGRAGQKSIRSPMTWASPLIFGNKKTHLISRCVVYGVVTSRHA